MNNGWSDKTMGNEKIVILSAGGTFDKVYYDTLSDYQIGDPQIEWIIQQAGVNFDYSVRSVLKKDSLDMNNDDRQQIKAAVEKCQETRIIITHGTDTMVETAKVLSSIPGKTIILTGAMQPARFRDSDAIFNTGFAIAAVQLLSPGTHIAMNGRIFTPESVRKNRQAGRFEDSAS